MIPFGYPLSFGCSCNKFTLVWTGKVRIERENMYNVTGTCFIEVKVALHALLWKIVVVVRVFTLTKLRNINATLRHEEETRHFHKAVIVVIIVVKACRKTVHINLFLTENKLFL